MLLLQTGYRYVEVINVSSNFKKEEEEKTIREKSNKKEINTSFCTTISYIFLCSLSLLIFSHSSLPSPQFHSIYSIPNSNSNLYDLPKGGRFVSNLDRKMPLRDRYFVRVLLSSLIKFPKSRCMAN